MDWFGSSWKDMECMIGIMMRIVRLGKTNIYIYMYYIIIYIYYDKTNDGILMGMTMGHFRLWFISNWGFMGDVTTDGNSWLEDKLERIRLVWIWANYNNSLTWNKAILGWFPLLTMISSEVAVRSWSNLPRIICRSSLGYPILSSAHVETGNVQWKMGKLNLWWNKTWQYGHDTGNMETWNGKPYSTQ